MIDTGGAPKHRVISLMKASIWMFMTHAPAEGPHAGDDAEALHDRRLDRFAVSAVCWMKRKDVRRSASAQVLENGALDCVFRPTAVAGAAHGTPSGTGFAFGKRLPPMTLMEKSVGPIRTFFGP